MKKKNSPISFAIIGMVLVTLSCSLFSRAIGNDESVEPESPASMEVIYQWAGSAKASSEYDNPDYAAIQATGAPDTPIVVKNQLPGFHSVISHKNG